MCQLSLHEVRLQCHVYTAILVKEDLFCLQMHDMLGLRYARMYMVMEAENGHPSACA